MSRVCQVTGKRPMAGNNVSHAKNRTRRRFEPNLHTHRFWIESEKRFVKLRVSTKGMRIIDKNGIGIWHIQPIFNDGRRDQDIVFPIHKFKEVFLQFFSVHLSMTDTNTRIWNESLEHAGHFLNILDSVMDKVDLSTTLHFIEYPIANHGFIKANHLTLDRITIRRGGCYDR